MKSKRIMRSRESLYLLMGLMFMGLILGSQAHAIDATSTLDINLQDEPQAGTAPAAADTDIFDEPSPGIAAGSEENNPEAVDASTPENDLTTKTTGIDFPDMSFSDVTLHEETIETAEISEKEINWLSATEEIIAIRYDKSVENFAVDYDGKNCYLRYSGKKLLAYIETENAVYPTWIVPADIPAVHIKLKKKNPLTADGSSSPMANQKGTTYSNNKETKLIEMVKFAYTDETEPINVAKLQKVNAVEGVRGYRFKSIKFEEGMYVEIYLFKLAPNSADDTVPIKETDFLLPELCYYPIGVSIEHPELRKDRFTRVFVIGAEKPEEDED